tara:strand:- start:143 stop:592 length:450 start_codon:yes stop_codon:yes gene_type:complete
MEVRFREVDPFNCWLWFRFKDVPNQGEKSYLNGVLDSWYVLGRLGGFNGENLQCSSSGDDVNWFAYDNNETSNVLPSLMHNLGELEYKDNWGRCWVDMGTSDLLAFDILINALFQLNTDIVELKELIVGGENENWSIEEHPDAIFSEGG